MTLYEALTEPHHGFGSEVFLSVPGGEEWTYGEFDELVGRFGTVLQNHGVAPGDRVMVQVQKSARALAIYLAALRIGAVYVPLNVAYTTHEVTAFAEDAEPAAVVFDPEVADERRGYHPAALTLDRDGNGTMTDLAVTAEPCRMVERRDDDPAAMLYTSGTTGRSKGAVLSNRNLASNARMLVQAWRFTPDDVLLHMLPIFHVHGLFVAVHCALLKRARISFHPRFDPAAVLDDLPNCSVVMGVPTQYTRLMADERLDRDRARHVRLFTCGSAPLPPRTHADFAHRTGKEILERYGMTEAGMITSNPYGGDRVPGTVGYPLPGVDVRIVDDDGLPVAPGGTGLVEARGPNVFSGYWRLPDKSAEALTPDGWLRTGDVGTLDATGRLSLQGRQSDMIISGGLNVYPREIEGALEDLANVIEAAVVGIPHPDLGEAVVAFIVGDEFFDRATAIGALDRLARFKHPKRFVLIDELPRNAMGKVQKARLRAEHQAMFTLDERR